MGKNDKASTVSAGLISEALKQLGYPVQGLKDASVRMSWVPELANDMIAYVKMGAPAINANAPVPPVLLRPLSDGFTVAALMTDYLLDPSGAFLMGSALITHHDEALNMLEKMVVEGVSVKRPDGSYVNRDVPAAYKFPQCQACGSRLFRRYTVCPECGSQV